MTPASGRRLIAVGRLVAGLCIGSTLTLVALVLVHEASADDVSAAAELARYISGAVAVVTAFSSWLIAYAAVQRTDIVLAHDERKSWRNTLLLLAFFGAWWFLFSERSVRRDRRDDQEA